MAGIKIPKIYSPYGPRRRRSAQLIIVWMVILTLVFVITYYLTSRNPESSAAYGQLLKEKGKGRVGGRTSRVVS